MAELDHVYGFDLSVGPDGDLLLASGTNEGTERVLRRLLTGRSDYLWHPGYGAGLPARVGELLNVPFLTAVIMSQMGLEAAVSQSPPPSVTVVPIPTGASAQITYVDSVTGLTVTSPTFDITQ